MEMRLSRYLASGESVGDAARSANETLLLVVINAGFVICGVTFSMGNTASLEKRGLEFDVMLPRLNPLFQPLSLNPNTLQHFDNHHHKASYTSTQYVQCCAETSSSR